jgi:hypothetical protein
MTLCLWVYIWHTFCDFPIRVWNFFAFLILFLVLFLDSNTVGYFAYSKLIIIILNKNFGSYGNQFLTRIIWRDAIRFSLYQWNIHTYTQIGRFWFVTSSAKVKMNKYGNLLFFVKFSVNMNVILIFNIFHDLWEEFTYIIDFLHKIFINK